tara:strand:- start:290 stop:1054 length:765 start_codon:yes stop_codon:yes gene_type:complete
MGKVIYDPILGKLRMSDASAGGVGGGSSQPFAFTADDYTDLQTKAGMTEGDLAYVESSQGTKWLPGTSGGTFYPKGIYLYNGTNWVSDRNAIALQLSVDDSRIDALELTTLANPSFNTLSIPDGTQSSASTWFFIKTLCPYDTVVTDYKTTFTTIIGEDAQVCVFAEDKTTRLDVSTLELIATDTTMTSTLNPTLVGGIEYWIGMKCTLGISSFLKDAAFSNTNVCVSIVDTGVPTSIIAATPSNVAPKITIRK